MDVISKITDSWKRLSLLWKLIVVNIAVFATVRIIAIAAIIGGFNCDGVIDNLALPASPHAALTHLWTLFSYMFTHYDPFHILFNMLALYWFGKLLTLRCSPKQLFALYLYAGVGGGLLFLASAQLLPAVAMTSLIGASASVMGILTALAILLPDFEVQFLLFGRIKLKWLAVGTLALFALGLAGNNAGGHVAHIGGMATGAIFALLFNRGIDITRPLNRALDRLAILPSRLRLSTLRSRHKGKKYAAPGFTPRQETDRRKPLDEQSLNTILDKIKHSGYSSLTADERQRLFDLSNNKQKRQSPDK